MPPVAKLVKFVKNLLQQEAQIISLLIFYRNFPFPEHNKVLWANKVKIITVEAQHCSFPEACNVKSRINLYKFFNSLLPGFTGMPLRIGVKIVWIYLERNE